MRVSIEFTVAGTIRANAADAVLADDRAVRKYPELLAKLASGALSLTAIRLLAPHFTASNFETLTREGGQATVKNIEMRCRAHNGFEWQRHLDEETSSLMSQ